jgi:uncharacterized LabA/DUF88 family protein
VSDERLKIAVFIDFDNIEIGVKTTLSQHFDVGNVLEAIKERGEVVTKIAYGDWTRAGEYGRAMSQHAIHMVQRNLTPGGDKNGADINLALDALEMAFTHNHINTFVIVGGDSDFISLVEKLKQYDRKVFVVGGRAFTSVVMQKNCTEFIAYENLVNRGRPAAKGKGAGGADLAQALPLVRRALKLLADREVLPQLGLLKSTLLQLDSAFSERDYGASSFRDFVQKLASAGYVALKGTERSFHVELKEAGESAGAARGGNGSGAPAEPARDARGRDRDREREKERERDREKERERVAEPQAASSDPVRDRGGDGESPSAGESLRQMQGEGFRIIREVFQRPGYTPRWPMYVRQVKQAVKNADDVFDERKYGFGGIIEALRYCQREGLFRIERDRMGVVRVFPGALLQQAAGEPVTLPLGAQDIQEPETPDVPDPTAPDAPVEEPPGREPDVEEPPSRDPEQDEPPVEDPRPQPPPVDDPRPDEPPVIGRGPSPLIAEFIEVPSSDIDERFVDEALGTPADADVLEGSQFLQVEHTEQMATAEQAPRSPGQSGRKRKPTGRAGSEGRAGREGGGTAGRQARARKATTSPAAAPAGARKRTAPPAGRGRAKKTPA